MEKLIIESLCFWRRDFFLRFHYINEFDIISTTHEFSYNENTYSKTLHLPTKNGSQLVSIENIIRMEAKSSYTIFYIDSFRKPIITSKSLKSYAAQLNPKVFIRSHQSHLVNLKFIQSINIKTNKYLTLKDGTTIKISRRKLVNIKKLLQS